MLAICRKVSMASFLSFGEWKGGRSINSGPLALWLKSIIASLSWRLLVEGQTFQREPRPEGHGASRARRLTVLQDILQDEHHRGGGHVAVVAENAAREAHLL